MGIAGGGIIMTKIENIITGDKQKSVSSWAKSNSISSEFADMLTKALKEPMEFIFFMSRMEKEFENMEEDTISEIRDSLIRIQVWCSINSHNDPVKAEKQLYISQVMEKLFFRGNLLLEESMLEDDEEEKEK